MKCKRSITDLTADDIMDSFSSIPYKSGVWVTKENSPDRLPFEDEYRYTFNKPRCIKDTQEVTRVYDVVRIYPTTSTKKEFYELNIIDRCAYTLKDGSVLLSNGSVPNKFILIRKEYTHG